MNQKTKKLLIPWIVFQIMLLVFFLISAFSQYRNRFQEHIFTPAGGVYYLTMGNYDSDQMHTAWMRHPELQEFLPVAPT